MKADDARDKAIQNLDKNPLISYQMALEAVRLYTNELLMAARPAQKNYLKTNIDRCLELAKKSFSYKPFQETEEKSQEFSPIKTETRFSDIVGLDDAKLILREDLLEFEHIKDLPGVKRPKGMILYGPPGCGKTMLGKALAGELSLDFYYVSCADILSKYYGESSKLVKTLFDTAKQKRSIIFIDEFEELASRKDSDSHEATRKIINQLLVELDGIERAENVYTIGATNIPLAIEPAILRRLRPLFIPLPDEETRKKLVSNITSGHEVDAEYIAHMTANKIVDGTIYYFSCDDVVELIGSSSRQKWREKRGKIRLNTDDIMKTLQTFTPSVSELDMKRYSSMISRS